MSTPKTSNNTALNIVRILTLVAILALGIYVALSPGIIYAPTPQVVLYLLISLLPAILLGVEGVTRFKLQLPGFLFTTAGTFAGCLGLLVLLTYLSKPQEQIAVYQIYDEGGQEVSLEWDGALNVSHSARGLSVSKFVDGNTVILIFPEQVGEAELQVKKTSAGPVFAGMVNYAGTRTLKLSLGRELKTNSP